jgi:guanylate kinase
MFVRRSGHAYNGVMLEDVHSLPGMLIIGSGPSGAGKNSVFSRVMELQKDRVQESVSCTTRDPRPGEVEGEDYYFLSLDEFSRLEKEGYFLESAGYVDRRYGTPIKPVLEKLKQGIDVLLVIEVKGAKMARDRMPGALTIFIMPGGDTLEQKTAQLMDQLNGRNGGESEEVIRKRLNTAAIEIEEAKEYQHVVVNAPGELEEAIQEVNEIIENAREERRARLAKVE